MRSKETRIQGVYLFGPDVHQDSRGSVSEAFRRDRVLKETGFDFQVAQINISISNKGTLRGVHFKKYPPGQAKFITVTQGRIIDVAIDLRRSSSTFGQYQSFEISDLNRRSLLLEYGIGHAFLAVDEDTRVTYLVDSVFDPRTEFGINPLEASIEWGKLAKPFNIKEFIISEKDQKAVSFRDATELLFD